MKGLNIHSLSATLAGLVLAAYWVVYLVVVVAPRIA